MLLGAVFGRLFSHEGYGWTYPSRVVAFQLQRLIAWAVLPCFLTEYRFGDLCANTGGRDDIYLRSRADKCRRSYTRICFL